MTLSICGHQDVRVSVQLVLREMLCERGQYAGRTLRGSTMLVVHCAGRAKHNSARTATGCSEHPGKVFAAATYWHRESTRQGCHEAARAEATSGNTHESVQGPSGQTCLMMVLLMKPPKTTRSADSTAKSCRSLDVSCRQLK